MDIGHLITRGFEKIDVPSPCESEGNLVLAVAGGRRDKKRGKLGSKSIGYRNQ